ncbi:kinase-like domain-containing protein [Infundibulicybe gibba]|nr:kinase-like domain-containing protein [Infundibulicybe gibba]
MTESSQSHLVPGFLRDLDHREADLGAEYRLLEDETSWRDLAPWLKERGYLLRPRYQADWIASWKGTNKSAFECEDAQVLPVPHIMDATRVSDQVVVALKRIQISESPDEAKIGRLFSSEPLSSDPHNHCVPIHDIIPLPNDNGEVLLVMPYLTSAYTPEFSTIGEVVEFFGQIFEGLQFMHGQRVAHRDCKINNIMMDSVCLYRKPVHPTNLTKTRDYTGRPKASTRTQRPVKYYLVDFGLSCRYDASEQHPLSQSFIGGDQTVPEFAPGVQVNPFPVDVYCIGNVVRRLTQGNSLVQFPPRKGFAFMEPLIADMVQDDPAKRPTMDEVVSRFADIRNDLSSWKLRSRFARRDENPVSGIFRSVSHWVKQAMFIVTRTPALPTPQPGSG